MEDGLQEKVEEKEVKPKPQPQKPNMVDVVVVKHNGKTSIVQYKRGTEVIAVAIPDSEVKDGKVADATLAAGVPYGFKWNKLPVQIVTPEMLMAKLYETGIFTLDDFINLHPAQYNAMIAELAGITKREVIDFAKKK